MNIPLVDLKRQFLPIGGDLEKVIKKVLKKGNFILGDEVIEFEEQFAKYCGTKYCIGVASGSDALLLSLRALGVGPKDEVITSANTFISTILPILALGAKPVLVDIDPKTYQIDFAKLEMAITKKTKVLLPVHLYGIPAPIKEITKIAKKNKLAILEDACQAHGSSIDGQKCGSFGIIGAFSFYPGKNLGAAGDGGAIVTSSKKLADKIRIMRNIGQTRKYKHDIIGYNSRLDTIQAAVLSIKLKKLNNWNQKRRELARIYDKLLADTPAVVPPKLKNGHLENFHLYVIRVPERNKLLEYLRKKGVFCGIHYPIPIHLQKSMKRLNYKRGDFPITEKFTKEILSLPMFAELKKLEIEYIAGLIGEFYQVKR